MSSREFRFRIHTPGLILSEDEWRAVEKDVIDKLDGVSIETKFRDGTVILTATLRANTADRNGIPVWRRFISGRAALGPRRMHKNVPYRTSADPRIRKLDRRHGVIDRREA